MSPGDWGVTGGATGIGSLPGSNPREAASIVAGELPELPHLPELPARGPWADITGRGCALLVDLPTQLSVGRWELTDRTGRDLRRARSLLAQDLDALEENLSGFVGPVKVQVCGPLTLAATVERRNGNRALSDPGACRDLSVSLAEGIAGHLRDVRRRLPAMTSLVVQIDEPALPMVVAGTLTTASGYRTLDPISADETRLLLRDVLAAVSAEVGHSVLHCCAVPVPLELLTTLEVEALSVPVAGLASDTPSLDLLGAWLDAGRRLFAGICSSDPATNVDLVRRTMSRAGLASDRVTSQLVMTPECGLANIAESAVVAEYRAIREAMRQLLDDPEGT